MVVVSFLVPSHYKQLDILPQFQRYFCKLWCPGILYLMGGATFGLFSNVVLHTNMDNCSSKFGELWAKYCSSSKCSIFSKCSPQYMVKLFNRYGDLCAARWNEHLCMYVVSLWFKKKDRSCKSYSGPFEFVTITCQ